MMTEQRFKVLKNSLKPEQFNNIDLLTKKAEELAKTDPDLSARILVRVNNLKKKQGKSKG